MLKYEWKKLLLNRRGLWIILVFLIAELAGIMLFTKPYDQVLEDNRAVYESYLTPVVGSLTQEKRDSLEKEMERLNQVHQDLEQLKQDYYAGKITEEAYRTGFDALLAEDQLYIGFSKLYSQYIFVREQENRSFLYTGGWETLLTDQAPDYLLLLLLVIVLVPVFCEEYASRMHDILLTQKHSARHQMGAKLCVALTLTAVLTAVIQFAKLGYCAAEFGLSNGSFSLQSLRSFGNARKELTLWQAFWLQFGLKELGCCYAAVCILFLSVLLKKYALTLMAGISFLPLPFLTVRSNDVFLRIPAPWALTLGSIYLNGDKTSTDALTGEEAIEAAELLGLELAGFVGVVVLICAAMLLFIRRKNTNHQLKKRKPAAAVAAVLAATLMLSGCGSSQASVTYNSTASQWCESESFMLLYFRGDTMLIDKKTGESHPFPGTAFSGESHTANPYFYFADGYAYYIESTKLTPNGGYDGSVTRTAVLKRLDMETLSESICYRWDTDSKWFFGLLDKEVDRNAALKINSFFLHGNGLYYIDTAERHLYRLDMTTGQQEICLRDMQTLEISYDGQRIYYADSYNRLVIRDLDTGEATAVDEVVVKTFALTPKGIYFLNRRDNNTLYYWDADAGEAVKLNDLTGTKIYYDAQNLWLMDASKGYLHRISYDGTPGVTISLPGSLCGISETHIYYQDKNQKLCSLRKEQYS